jgi:lipoprotein-anchoring transpeptidase ErfK/SrfK
MGLAGRSIVALTLAATCWAASAPPAHAREVVAFSGFSAGTVVVKTGERKLYLALGHGRAILYVVGVGRPGKQWAGRTVIKGKYVNPSFAPPAEVKRDLPHLPAVIPPGPKNPLGPRAMTLAIDQYAIHGTNRPDSIGKFVSYGCIRMHNRDVVDLFERVKVGTPVVVLP